METTPEITPERIEAARVPAPDWVAYCGLCAVNDVEPDWQSYLEESFAIFEEWLACGCPALTD